MSLTSWLKPTGAQARRLALRETDPACASSFEPIARGPIVGLLLLALVGLAAVFALPVALLARLFRGSR